MKKIHILSLSIAWMLGLASYAQNNGESVLNGCLGYWYAPNGVTFVDDASMGEPVFVGFENYEEDSEIGLLEDLGEYGPKPVKSGAREAYVGVYADGTLRLTGRQLCYTPYDIELLENTSSSILLFGSFVVPDNTDALDLPSEIVTYDEDEGHYVVNDPYRQYWLVYRAALEAGLEVCRGSGIDVDYDVNGTEISHVMYQNELMYFKQGNDYFPVTSVTFGDNNDSSFPMELVNCTKKIVVNEYPENILDGSNAQTVKVQPDVTVLPSFTKSSVKYFDVDSENKIYTTEAVNANSNILCAKGADGKAVSVIALPKLQSTTIDLPYYITSINEGALPEGVEGLKVVTKNGDLVNNSDLVAWVSGEDTKANSLKKDVSLSLTKTDISVNENFVRLSNSAESFGYYGSEGQEITKAKFNEFLSDVVAIAGLRYIDLSNCTFDDNDLGEITMANVNPNCLLFLPAGVSASGDNIVTMDSEGKRTCGRLNLVRQTGAPFANPHEFDAEQVSVGYSIGTNLVGLVLPFKYKNINVKKAVFSGYSEGSILLNNLTETDGETVATEIDANTPFVAQKKDGVADQAIVASNVTIETTSNIHDDFVDGWTMSGTYLPVTNYGSDYTIYGYAKNKLMRVDGATFKPFSGYFVCNKSNGALEAKFRFVSDDITTSVDAPESIFAVKAQNGTISVVASGANVVIASVNGAVLFNGKVNGTLTKDVNPGVYVVNGKKVVVNK